MRALPRWLSRFLTSALAHPARVTPLLGGVLLAAGACSDSDSAAGSITVFAAASLTEAFEETGDEFEAEHPGVSVSFNFAGSSSLREQILAGAPADIFASADEPTMTGLATADALSEDPTPFASNRLEIAVPPGNPGEVTGLADLTDPELLVGLCAEEVPCGRLARQLLDDVGIDASVDTNEPSVRGLLTKVEAGELDAGLVYRTDVLAAGNAVEGVPLPANATARSTYPVAPLTDATDSEVAQAFIDFLLSDAGQAILSSHGFDSP